MSDMIISQYTKGKSVEQHIVYILKWLYIRGDFLTLWRVKGLLETEMEISDETIQKIINDFLSCQYAYIELPKAFSPYK